MSALPDFHQQGNHPQEVFPQQGHLPQRKNLLQLACTGEQGCPIEQGCSSKRPTEQGFTSERKWSSTEQYQPQQGYLPEQGYSADEGYAPGRGYLPGQGYPPQPEYPPQSAPPAYDEKQTIEVAPINTTTARDTQEQPNDYLWLAMFVTFCCCFPLGLIGWIESCEVQSRFQSGDYNEAKESSKSAWSWSIGGLLCGVLTWVMAVIVPLLYLFIVLESPGKAFRFPSQKGYGGDALTDVQNDDDSSYVMQYLWLDESSW